MEKAIHFLIYFVITALVSSIIALIIGGNILRQFLLSEISALVMWYPGYLLSSYLARRFPLTSRNKKG